MLFWYNLVFWIIKIRRNFKKKWRVASGNQMSSKAKKFIGLRKFCSQKSSPAKRGFPCKTISQPKRPCREIEVLLRNKPPSAKSFHSHKPTPWEILPRHMCVISQPKSSFHSCEMSCETLQSQISQLQASPVKNFVAAKHSLGTRVPFRSPPTPFHSFEMACKTSCEIIPWLRNHPFAAKWAFSCENLNRHLNHKLNL